VKFINKKSLYIILQRLGITLVIIFFFRFGNLISVPVINEIDLAIFIQKNPSTALIRFSNDKKTLIIGLFCLNIYPYINASILIQVLMTIVPSIAQLKKDGDFSSRRSLNKLIRFITLICAFIESALIGILLKPILFDWNFTIFLQIILTLTTGSMITLWLSELITEYGLGKGVSLFIYLNILSNSRYLWNNSIDLINNFNGIFKFTILFIVLLIGVITLQDGTKKIPLISLKQLNQKSTQSENTIDFYIPLKLNQAGVMPIILTAVFTSIFNSFYFSKIIPQIPESFLVIIYGIFYVLLIQSFSLVYSSITLNPKDITERLKKTSVFIDGIKPGSETTFYLKRIQQRLTIIGASILTCLAILPNISGKILQFSINNGLNTISLVIMAAVLIEILTEVEDIIFSNVYKKDFTII